MIVLEFIKKRYLIICIILIGLGLYIDIYYNEISINSVSQSIRDLKGNTTSFDILTTNYKYEILKVVANLCYGLAVSLVVLLSLELKYDDLEREKVKIFESQERVNFEKTIRDLQEKINVNIFDGVLKKLIPQELFDIIARDILSKSIIRQNAHWIYDVTEGKKSNYIVKQTISYELKNIGKSRHTETLRVAIPELKRCSAFIEFFKIEMNGKVIEEKKKEDLDRLSVVEGDIKVFTNDLHLNSEEVAKVIISIVNEFNDKNAFDVHSSNYSIVGLTIEANKPEDCNFNIFPNFTSKLNVTKPSKTKLIYEKIPGILVGQGLSYSAEQYHS